MGVESNSLGKGDKFEKAVAWWGQFKKEKALKNGRNLKKPCYKMAVNTKNPLKNLPDSKMSLQVGDRFKKIRYEGNYFEITFRIEQN